MLEFVILKRSQKGITNNQNGTKSAANVSQGTSQNIFGGNEAMNLQKNSVRKEVERSDETGGYWLMPFGCVLSKFDKQNVIAKL